MSEQLTLQEQQELADLQRQEAALLQASNPVPEPSVYFDTMKRTAMMAGQGISEATGAALGQKIGMAAAPWTAGLSVPVGGAIGGVSGYEAFQRASGQEPTWGGRLVAGALGAIPFGPEARLIGAAGKATGQELAQRAAGQSALNLGLAQAGKAVDTGEMLTPTEAALAVTGGAAGGAMSRLAAGTAGQDVQGKPLYVAGSKRAAKALEERTRNLEQDAVLENYRAVGGVSDPMAMNRGFIAESVESLAGGQQALREKLTAVNQEVNSNLARRQLGLSSDVPLSVDTFSKLRNAANQVYQEVADLGKRPAATEETGIIVAPPHREAYGTRKTPSRTGAQVLNDLEDARAEMKQNWRKWSSDRAQNKVSDPDLLANAEAATKRVEKLEDTLQGIAEKYGKPELANELKAARKQLAQIHTVESAMSSAKGGQLDALVIGEINRAAPKLLTDNLKLIGDAANVQRQEHIMGTIARETNQSPGISRPVRAITAGGSYPIRNEILQFASKPGGFYQKGAAPYYPSRAPSGLGLFLRNAPSAAMSIPNQPQ